MQNVGSLKGQMLLSNEKLKGIELNELVVVAKHLDVLGTEPNPQWAG